MVPFGNPSWLTLVPDPPLNDATGIPVILRSHVTHFFFPGQRSTLICTVSKFALFGQMRMSASFSFIITFSSLYGIP